MATNDAFFVIEDSQGTNGRDQVNLLAERLRADGYDVATFAFPRIDEPSSYFAKQFLGGEYGSAATVGPYTGSLFFALDHYQAGLEVRKALANGKVVLASGLGGAIMSEQGALLANDEERRGYYIWLDNLEHVILKVPRPVKNFILRIPAAVAQEIADREEGALYPNETRHNHNSQFEHQQALNKVYDDLSQLFPRDFQRIDCVRSGKLLNDATITDILLAIIGQSLPEKSELQELHEQTETPTQPQTKASLTEYNPQQQSSSSPKVHVPSGLFGDVAEHFRSVADKIIKNHQDIITGIEDYLHTSGHKDATSISAQANAAARLVIPVASTPASPELLSAQQSDAQKTVAELASKALPPMHSIDYEAVRLSSFAPRNEIDLTADMLYDQTNLSLSEISQEVAKLPYSDRLNIFTAYLNSGGPALNNSSYNWDILCDFEVFNKIKDSHAYQALQRQDLSPRFGYDMPDLIDQAGLGDKYEECFDLSAELYSYLQEKGHPKEAQVATLLGHRVRCTFKQNGSQLADLLQSTDDDIELRKLLNLLHQKLAEAHPITADSLQVKSRNPN